MVKGDFLNLITENIGLAKPFTIRDLDFVNQDYNFKRRHLSDLADPERWGPRGRTLIRRLKKGLYEVPEDFREIYEEYREASLEEEAEEREREKTRKRRAIYSYKLALREARREGRDLEEVEVPDGVPPSQAAMKILEKDREKHSPQEREEPLDDGLRPLQQASLAGEAKLSKPHLADISPRS